MTFDFYHKNTPHFISDIAETPVMQRLKNVGMNCGCEYTSFPRFSSIHSYSRFDHSLGAGLITWHFTEDICASAAALLHDVATPVFAHTVDFMNGDYILQESTESRTAGIISSSLELMSVLKRYGLTVEDVADYHRYPIADNNSPKLSSDRLEYTLGNVVNYCFADIDTIKRLYQEIVISRNEDGEPELAFSALKSAEEFALYSINCSRIYASPEDRYSMQILSELLSDAVNNSVITCDDLYTDEPTVISKLIGNEETKNKWEKFRSLSHMVSSKEYTEQSRVISAKKRRIDPLVNGQGRVSELSRVFREELSDFLLEDFSIPIAAI